jgi:hypothetical protein
MLRKKLFALVIAGSLGSALVAAQHEAVFISVMEAQRCGIDNNKEYAAQLAEAKMLVDASFKHLRELNELKKSLPQDTLKVSIERLAPFESEIKALMQKTSSEDCENTTEIYQILMGEEEGKKLADQLFEAAAVESFSDFTSSAYAIIFQTTLPALEQFFQRIKLLNEQFIMLIDDYLAGMQPDAQARALGRKAMDEREKLSRLCELMKKSIDRSKQTLPDVYALYVKVFPEIFAHIPYEEFEQLMLRVQNSFLIVARDLLVLAPQLNENEFCDN